MTVRANGAQRASIHRSRRLTMFALMAALAVSLGAMAVPQATSAASIKVVVVVGPAGYSTADYRNSARTYAAIARGYGCEAVRIEQSSELVDGVTRALASDRPTVLDVIVSSQVPTLY